MSLTVTEEVEFDTMEEVLRDISAGRWKMPVRLDAGRRYDRDSFLEFCQANPDVEAELRADGTLELMTPQVFLSGRRELRVASLLLNWWDGCLVGQVGGPSNGYALPSGAVRAPDASWISQERFDAIPPGDLERFPRVVPDFVIEVMSKSDNLKQAKKKMSDTWMPAGVRLGWLIRPSVEQVLIYREGEAEPEVLKRFDRVIDAGEVVPGFSIDLTRLR